MRESTVVAFVVALVVVLVLVPGSAVHANEERAVLGTGMAPGEVYKMIHRAKWSVDDATVFACTSKRAMKTREEAMEKLMAERYTLAQTVELLDQRVEETAAMVLYKGQRRDRDTGKMVTMRGDVTFVKEDGVWRVLQDSWKDVSEEEYVSVDPRRDQNWPPVSPKQVQPPATEKTQESAGESNSQKQGGPQGVAPATGEPPAATEPAKEPLPEGQTGGSIAGVDVASWI